METIYIAPKDEQEWLALRTQDITSTEVAALFGYSPYVTQFELWHRKKSGVAEAIETNERMKWGNRLQDAIALGVCEEHNWTAKKFTDYARIPSLRIGSSFDWSVENQDGDIGILEIKNVDRSVFAADWSNDDDLLLAPPHIEMQLQHQLLVTGRTWGCIAALVGGNQLHIGMRTADREVHDVMRQKIAWFWKSIDDNNPPSPSFPEDAQFVAKKLYNKALDGCIAHSTPEVDALLAEYASVSQQAKLLEEQRDTLKARVLMQIGPAAKVISPLGNLTCSETAANPGTLVTPEMVGTYLGGRKAFRQFRFTPKKSK